MKKNRCQTDQLAGKATRSNNSWFLLSFIIFIVLPGPLHQVVLGQNQSSGKKLTITYSWNRINSHGSNQLAVWIEDAKENHISTLFATRYTAKGGYKERPVSLSEWTSKFDIRHSTKEQIDAISGATPQSGPQVLVWNGKDKSGKLVPDGTYFVRIEANIKNGDKMFYKCSFKLGGGEQKTSGEITYSSPQLASGPQLFKDVRVECASN